MNIFLRRIAASTKRSEIYDFVAPALRNGLFQKSGHILNIDILALKDLRTGGVEHHGLVALDSNTSLQHSLLRLQNKQLNGKAIEVRQYYHRSWYNDPRLHDMPLNIRFVEKRKADRRRGSNLEVIRNVSDHFNTESLKSTTLQHCMASFIVPTDIETVVAQSFAKFDFQSQPLLLNQTLNIDSFQYLAGQDGAENTSKYFQIFAEKNDIYSLLDKLRAHYPESGIQYWITSIDDTGKI